MFSSVFRPGGLLIPLSCPMDFFWGGTKVPAVEAGPRDEATATMDHRPWPPELPAPPWPPSVCFALEAPSCVCLCVGPVGSPECPPPLPGSTVTARDAPSGRGELCQTSVVCVLCSRLLFPYTVCFLSSFHVIISSFGSRCVCDCVYYPVYLSPVCWVPCRLVYSLFLVFLSVYLALSYLDVVIKDYYFEVSPRLRVPRFSLLCAPWQLHFKNTRVTSVLKCELFISYKPVAFNPGTEDPLLCIFCLPYLTHSAEFMKLSSNELVIWIRCVK